MRSNLFNRVYSFLRPLVPQSLWTVLRRGGIASAFLHVQVQSIRQAIAPLQLNIAQGTPRRVNILIGMINFSYVFGGYLSIFHLALALAARGLRVRLVLVDPGSYRPGEWRARFAAYPGLEFFLDRIEVFDAHNRSHVLDVSPNDAFMATSWWSAHVAHRAARHLGQERFVYLSQDYEPVFYPMGSLSALAAESYTLPHYALYSTELLRDYSRQRGLGVYTGGSESGDQESIAFENAITPVRPPTADELARRSTRRFLFYARPEEHARRNMFELGMIVLSELVEEGVFDERWEFSGIGALGRPLSLPLPRGQKFRLLPRTGLTEYAALLREHDLGMSLMLTPHPSLVPLEMASAGMVTVTNTYANKTALVLTAISTNLIPAEPTVEGLKKGLREGIARVESPEARIRGAHVQWSTSWAKSFSPAFITGVICFLDRAAGSPLSTPTA